MQVRPVEEHAPGRDAPRRPTRRQVEEVEAQLRQTSERIAAYPEHTIAALLPHIRAAQNEVAAGMRRWLSRVKDGNLRYTHHLLSGTLLELEAARKAIERRLGPAMGDQMVHDGAAQNEAALRGLLRDFARMRDVFGGAEGNGRIDFDMAALLVKREQMLFPRYRTSAARYADNTWGDIQAELVKGVLRRETVYEMTERLVALGGPRGQVALKGVLGEPGAESEYIAEGLFKRYRYWAHRIVRTEMQWGANQILDAGIRKLADYTPGLCRRWDASMDRRVCSTCFELHNTTAPIGGEFPGGFTDAPAHPNCRCRVGAWHEAWAPYLAWMQEIQ